MADVKRPFESYTITYSSGGKGGGPDVIIGCWSSGKYVGSINFSGDDEQLPTNIIVKDGQSVVLHFPLSRFNDVINILRYEKPLSMYIFDSGLGYIFAGSSPGGEPVGEQEPMSKPVS
jgi:hypothetical protein